MENFTKPPKLSKFMKYVKKIENVTKYVKICINDEICKNMSLHTNLSVSIINLSCFTKNMYYYIQIPARIHPNDLFFIIPMS